MYLLLPLVLVEDSACDLALRLPVRGSRMCWKTKRAIGSPLSPLLLPFPHLAAYHPAIPNPGCISHKIILGSTCCIWDISPQLWLSFRDRRTVLRQTCSLWLDPSFRQLRYRRTGRHICGSSSDPGVLHYYSVWSMVAKPIHLLATNNLIRTVHV